MEQEFEHWLENEKDSLFLFRHILFVSENASQSHFQWLEKNFMHLISRFVRKFDPRSEERFRILSINSTLPKQALLQFNTIPSQQLHPLPNFARDLTNQWRRATSLPP